MHKLSFMYVIYCYILLKCFSVVLLFLFTIVGDTNVVLGEPYTFEDIFNEELKPQLFSAQWIGGNKHKHTAQTDSP